MEKRKERDLKSLLQAPKQELWTECACERDYGNQYWYQRVEFFGGHEHSETNDSSQKKIALLGYACDEGVRRNYGRTGAVLGPQALRRRLARLPVHFEDKRIIDAGDILCFENNLERSQDQLRNHVCKLLQKNTFPVVIGGGHDVAYGHLMGILDFLGNGQKTRVGIINFDAHFDLRPADHGANSGTPFSQIQSFLSSAGYPFDYFVIGIQQQSNTRALFQIANDFSVKYIINDDCQMPNLAEIKKELEVFIEHIDWIFVTIDLDGFAAPFAPGVSAPSPLGFTPAFAVNLLAHLFSTRKIIGCDIAELNPNYDIDNATANLAARLVDFIVTNY